MGGKEIARKFFRFSNPILIYSMSELFFSITWFSNLPWLTTPTTTWSVTLALAIVVFLSIHYYGVKEKVSLILNILLSHTHFYYH